MTKRNMIRAALGAALFGSGCMIGSAFAAQPHMQAALGALQTARSELQQAVADKGGHRVKALDHVDQAIAETRAGMSYAGY